MRGAVVENSSKEALESKPPKGDGTQDVGHDHYVEVGGTAGLENIIPQFSKMTIHNIAAAKDSMCSVIELEAEPLREMVMKNDALMQKIWGFI